MILWEVSKALQLPGQVYTIENIGVNPVQGYILPTFQLIFRRTSRPIGAQASPDYIIYNYLAELRIDKDGTEHVISSYITADSFLEVWKEWMKF